MDVDTAGLARGRVFVMIVEAGLDLRSGTQAPVMAEHDDCPSLLHRF